MGEFLKGKLKSLKLLRHARRLRHCFCFVLEALADILKFFWKPTAFDKNKVKKILAIRLDRIGDLVLTTPALRALKEGYPGSQLSVLTRRTTKDLIVGLSFVDEVIVFEDFDQDRLVGRLREGHFDVSVGFHPDMLVNYLPWSADIPARVGYKCCGSGLFLTKSLVDDREKRIRHEVTSALEVVAKIGATTRDTSLAVALGKDSEDFADRFFQENGLCEERVVVVHPGSRQPYIRWPHQRFAVLADRLILEKKVKILLIGGPDERDLVAGVKSLMTQKPVVATGLVLKHLVSLIKRSKLFIGNSTGPMHIAAALKVPVVAIFGSRHPKDSFQEWGPWGLGHEVVSKETPCAALCHPGDCLDYACLDAVTVDDVFKAAEKKL